MEISPRLPAATVCPGWAGLGRAGEGPGWFVLASHSPATALVPLLTSDTRHITSQLRWWWQAGFSQQWQYWQLGAVQSDTAIFPTPPHPTLTLLIWSFVSEPFPLSLEPRADWRRGRCCCQLQPRVHCVCPGLLPAVVYERGTLYAVFMAELGLAGCGNNGTRQQIGPAAPLLNGEDWAEII